MTSAPIVDSPILQRMYQRYEKTKSFNSDDGLVSTKEMYELQWQAYQRIFRLASVNDVIVWTNSYNPSVIFSAFRDVLCVGIEGPTYLAGVWNMSPRYLAIADQVGFSRDCCSSIRAQVGMALCGEIPKPDLFITNSQTCDGYRPWDFVAEKLGVPIFHIDTPFELSENAVRYFVSELEAMITFIEEHTGQKLDWQRLRTKVKRNLEISEVIREINELRKAVPHPMKGRDSMRYGMGYGGGGSDLVAAGVRAMRDEIRARVEAGRGAVPEERYRLLWCQTPPFYVDLTTYLEQEFGAVVAFNDPHKHIWWEPGFYDDWDDPLEIIAHEFITDPWNGKAERRVNTLVQNAIDYKCHGAIFFRSWGCRNSGAEGRIFQDTLMERVGIPSLILDGDYIDSDNYSDAETKVKIESFIMML